jgi:hypothetical protein
MNNNMLAKSIFVNLILFLGIPAKKIIFILEVNLTFESVTTNSVLTLYNRQAWLSWLECNICQQVLGP